MAAHEMITGARSKQQPKVTSTSTQHPAPSTQPPVPSLQHQAPSPQLAKIPLDDDMRLMIQACQGDRSVYGDLYIKYYQAVKDFLASLNGHDDSQLEDLAQRVFIRVWENREKYTPQSKVKTYLFAIAKHVVQEDRRRQGRNVLASAESLKHDNRVDAQSLDPCLQATHTELGQLVNRAMSKLPYKQKQAFELFHLLGLSHRDASEIAGCPEKVLECRLYRAHQNLRRVLKSTDL